MTTITINGNTFTGLKYAKQHKYIFESSGMEMINAMNDTLSTFDETEENGKENIKIYKKERMKIMERNKKNNFRFHKYIKWYNLNKHTTEGEMVNKFISPALYFPNERSLLAYEMLQDKKKDIYKPPPPPVKYNVKRQYEEQPIKVHGTVYTMIINDGNIDEDFLDGNKNEIINIFASPIAKPETNLKKPIKSRQELILALFKQKKASFKLQNDKPTHDDIIDKFYQLTTGHPKKNSPKVCIQRSSFKDWVDAMVVTNCGVQLFEGAQTHVSRIRSLSSNITYQSNIRNMLRTTEEVFTLTQSPTWTDTKTKKIAQQLNSLMDQPFIEFMQEVKSTGADQFDNILCQPLQKIKCKPEKKMTYSNKGQTRCALQALIQWCDKHNLLGPGPVGDQSTDRHSQRDTPEGDTGDTQLYVRIIPEPKRKKKRKPKKTTNPANPTSPVNTTSPKGEAQGV